MPLKTGWRTRPSSVQSVNSTSAWSFGSQNFEPRGGVGAPRDGGGVPDPGGGYGWRSGRALGGTYSLGKVAGRAEPIELRPLGLLLLPQPLERFALRPHAEDLLAGAGVLAVEPPRLGASGRVPAAVADGLSAGQARRLKLPGVPRAILVFHPLQYPLARGLIAHHPDAELWYWRRETEADRVSRRRRERLEELDLAASLRASLLIADAEERFGEAHGEGCELMVLEPGDDPHEDNRPLFRRLEMLGIESGRLGSERL